MSYFIQIIILIQTFSVTYRYNPGARALIDKRDRLLSHRRQVRATLKQARLDRAARARIAAQIAQADQAAQNAQATQAAAEEVPPPLADPVSSDTSDERPVIKFHIPMKKPATANCEYPRLRCRECFQRGIRLDTRFYCVVCPRKPGLCPPPKLVLWTSTKDSYSPQVKH